MDTKDLEAFQRVVLAGMKLMYDEKTFKIFQTGLTRKDRPMPQRLAMEAGGLMKMLAEKSKGRIPPQVVAPAAAMLLMEMGKFMTEAGIDKPTEDDIRKGIALLMQIIKALFAKGGQQPQGQPQPQQPAPAQPQGGLIQQPQPQPMGA